MKFFDSSKSQSEEVAISETHLPLLPNPIDSKYWNQKYKKRVFTQVMKAEGLCKSLHYKKGHGPEWWEVDNNLIKWEDFAGPSQAPKGFPGNFSEFLFKRILACYKFNKVDTKTHIHNPPLGKYQAMVDNTAINLSLIHI